MKQKPGPKPETAPPGYVTIEQAAEKLELSYSGVYRHLDKVKTSRSERGTIYIRSTDLAKIRNALRKPADGDRRAIAVRVPAERLARWEQAILRKTPAGEEPIAVSRWLSELGDAAANEAGA